MNVSKDIIKIIFEFLLYTGSKEDIQNFVYASKTLYSFVKDMLPKDYKTIKYKETRLFNGETRPAEQFLEKYPYIKFIIEKNQRISKEEYFIIFSDSNSWHYKIKCCYKITYINKSGNIISKNLAYYSPLNNFKGKILTYSGRFDYIIHNSQFIPILRKTFRESLTRFKDEDITLLPDLK